MYTKTNWQDRVVENPSTYTLRENDDGTITLIPAPGTIQSSGTPIKAEYLNNMEKGIEDAHQEIKGIKEDYSLKHDHPYLPTKHPSASFGYNASTGRITHNGNDVKVLNSVNADSAASATKWNGMQMRTGAGLSGASGYITFTW